jgi:hypothetical protein
VCFDVRILQVLARKWCNITSDSSTSSDDITQSHLFPESRSATSGGDTMCQYLQEPDTAALLETINITAVKHAADNDLQSAQCTSGLWCTVGATSGNARDHLRVRLFAEAWYTSLLLFSVTHITLSTFSNTPGCSCWW